MPTNNTIHFLLVLLLIGKVSNAVIETEHYTSFTDTQWTGLSSVSSRSLVDCARLCTQIDGACPGFNWNPSLEVCQLIGCPQVQVSVTSQTGWILYISDTYLARYNAWKGGIPTTCTLADTKLVSPVAAGFGKISCTGGIGIWYYDNAIGSCLTNACNTPYLAGFIAYNHNSGPTICRFEKCLVGDDLTPQVDTVNGAADLYLRLFCV